jgi:hypothetical protein
VSHGDLTVWAKYDVPARSEVSQASAHPLLRRRQLGGQVVDPGSASTEPFVHRESQGLDVRAPEARDADDI